MKQKTSLRKDRSEVAEKQGRQREINIAVRIGVANVSEIRRRCAMRVFWQIQFPIIQNTSKNFSTTKQPPKREKKEKSVGDNAIHKKQHSLLALPLWERLVEGKCFFVRFID